MNLFDTMDPTSMTPGRVWAALDPPTRLDAARSMYAGDRDLAREADLAVAGALRFRDAAVRQLPREKRAAYLVSRVRPDEQLAASLLMALHLTSRVELLTGFLDSLEIPHESGLIDPDFELEQVDASRFGDAVKTLYDTHPADRVEVYIASLIAMDPEIWQPLAEHVRRGEDEA